jgi:hypothetical protein
VSVQLSRSIPESGFSFPLSGIGTPAFRTRIELLLIVTGLLPDETIALKLASITTKNRMDAIIIPVIVARVYLRKLLIFLIGLMERILNIQITK